MNVIEKVFGTHSERELKRILPIVDKIESLRDDMMALTDEQLKDKTKEYKTRLAQGETLRAAPGTRLLTLVPPESNGAPNGAAIDPAASRDTPPASASGARK